MREFKGTPGPWVVEEESFTVTDESGEFVADFDSGPWKENHANADLIAAAPELLEALQELFADYKQLADSGDAGFWNLEDTEVGKKSLAAIAKALGK